VYIPKSTLHRLENPGKVALEIIEVQNGEYVEEDDIVRLDDVYGRLKRVKEKREIKTKQKDRRRSKKQVEVEVKRNNSQR
jgi:oxalate decarboxylase/phosphoglucose isomerase-like protein (cupin superfamily)